MIDIHWLGKNTVSESHDWLKPERADQAGKVLVVGGNIHEFSKVQSAYQIIKSQNLGQCKVVLPDVLRSKIGQNPDVEFASSTKMGSFSSDAYTELRGFIAWADSVLLAGDLSRNSETTQLIEKIIALDKKFVVAKDALDLLLKSNPANWLNADSYLVGDFYQMQQLAIKLKSQSPITRSTGLLGYCSVLSELCSQYGFTALSYYENNLILILDGAVYAKKHDELLWQNDTSAKLSYLINWPLAKDPAGLLTSL